MICFYEKVNSISWKIISFFCQKAHHGYQWIGKHIIVVYSVISYHCRWWMFGWYLICRNMSTDYVCFWKSNHAFKQHTSFVWIYSQLQIHTMLYVPHFHLHEHFEQLQQRGAFSVSGLSRMVHPRCAPAHWRIIVKERLKELFNHRVIALNYDPEWPPRSPDLTPCDFFFFGGISRAKCSRHGLETV